MKDVGTGIQKRFWAFENLVDAGRLAEIKLVTNLWEDEYRRQATWLTSPPESRQGTLRKPNSCSPPPGSRPSPVPGSRHFAEERSISRRNWCPRDWTYPTIDARIIINSFCRLICGNDTSPGPDWPRHESPIDDTVYGCGATRLLDRLAGGIRDAAAPARSACWTSRRPGVHTTPRPGGGVAIWAVLGVRDSPTGSAGVEANLIPGNTYQNLSGRISVASRTAAGACGPS
jgi:hypothetical protein